MSNFVKLSALTNEDKSKVNKYWTELWGSEFASALVEYYTSDAKTKEVEASSKKKVK